MRTKVFAYNGILGIESDPEKAEGLLNDPMQDGQLGTVLDAAYVDFSQEALDLLKTIQPSSDCIGDVDVFKAEDGVVVFCFLGFHRTAFRPEEIQGSRDYDPSLLTIAEEIEIPESFKTFVDSISEDVSNEE